MELKYDNNRRFESPLKFIEEFLSLFNKDKNITLEFSVYKSGGQGITIYRKKKRISSDYLNTIKELTNSLQEGEELAINSRCFIDNKIRYIPICDFSFKDIEDAKSNLSKILNYLKTDLYIYKSGRSFHMYTFKLLSLREWAKFCGYLLLLNPPEKPFVYVDSRWIGHSLEQGFGALRLTNKTSSYLQTPSLIKVFKYE